MFVCIILLNILQSLTSDANYHLFHLLCNTVTFYQQKKYRHPYLFLMELVPTVSVLSLMDVTLCFFPSCHYNDTELHCEEGEKMIDSTIEGMEREKDDSSLSTIWPSPPILVTASVTKYRLIYFSNLAKSSNNSPNFSYQIETHPLQQYD